MPYSSQTHARRWVNFLNAQNLCVFSFTLTDQCVSSTSVNSPTYTVTTPLSYSRSTRSRTSAFCARARRFVRYRYSRRIHFEEWSPSRISTVGGRFRRSSRGTVRITPDHRRGTGSQWSLNRRQDCLDQCQGRLHEKPVVSSVENQGRD